MGHLVPHFECWIVGQGKGLKEFKLGMDKELVSRIQWFPFVSPWEMPYLLNQLDAIFVFESALPHPVVSNLVLEAISSGLGIIIDRLNFTETYRNIVTLNQDQVLVVSPFETSLSASRIEQWVEKRAFVDHNSNQRIKYQEYITLNEMIYVDILNSETK